MLEDISVFTVIAKHQSFSKAARELNLSTPVVTRRLARLEKLLGARLLHRTTRQVTLTEAGTLFYAEVNDILSALDASKESIKSLVCKVTGTLKVGLPFAFNQCFVTQKLNHFLVEHPALKIQIESGNNLLGLLNNGYDLIIHSGNLSDSSFHFKKLGAIRKILCASPAYLAKHGTPKNIEDLLKHNCLGSDSNFANGWQYQDKGRDKEILVSGNVNTNNAFDLRALAINDVGIVYLSHFIVKKELEAGTLVPVLDDYQKTQDIYAVYPTAKFLNKKTQLFLNFIIELIAPLLA